MTLVEELDNKVKELDEAIKRMRYDGVALAQAERDYKVLLRTEVLKLRDGGMQVTIIKDIVRGIPEVAELRLNRDIAQTFYEADKELINSIKLQIRVLQSQFTQEWGFAKYE
jgi:hypothetical protein